VTAEADQYAKRRSLRLVQLTMLLCGKYNLNIVSQTFAVPAVEAMIDKNRNDLARQTLEFELKETSSMMSFGRRKCRAGESEVLRASL
jgi:hypothetical protein